MKARQIKLKLLDVDGDGTLLDGRGNELPQYGIPAYVPTNLHALLSGFATNSKGQVFECADLRSEIAWILVDRGDLEACDGQPEAELNG